MFVVVYALLAMVSVGVAVRQRTAGDGEGFKFWAALSTIIALLALDRAFAAGDAVANAIRSRARRREWYADRRNLQVALTSVAGLLAIAGIIFVARLKRTFSLPMNISLIAISSLIALRLARLVSLHDLDEVLRFKVGGVRLFVLLESACVALLGWAATNSLIRTRR